MFVVVCSPQQMCKFPLCDYIIIDYVTKALQNYSRNYHTYIVQWKYISIDMGQH